MSFTLKLGSLDLSSYVRVAPGEGLDLAAGGFLEPAFSESPLLDGQYLSNVDVQNKQLAWPLFLNAADKDALHSLIRQIKEEENKPGRLRVEWADKGATNSTFFDVEFVRFEPDFNFRRQEHSYMGGTLRIWVRPYGHTATSRIIATGVATGVVLTVPIPSAISGDHAALLDGRVNVGSYVPQTGRIVALAALPNASYVPDHPAASFTSLMSGASLTGASGAAGSQYMALPVSPTVASGYAMKLSMAVPSLYAGANRVFAVARSTLSEGVAVRAFEDLTGFPLGPTTIASSSTNWGLIDLGVLRVPTVANVPARIAIAAAGLSPASGVPAASVYATQALHVNRLVTLPEKSLTAFVDPGGQLLAYDDFYHGSAASQALVGMTDLLGNVWENAQAFASQAIHTLSGETRLVNVGTTLYGAAQPNLPPVTDGRWDINLHFTDSTSRVEARKVAASNNWVAGRAEMADFVFNANSISVVVCDNGATSVIASKAASFPNETPLRLVTLTQGPVMTVSIEQSSGAGLVASLAASHARIADTGKAGFAQMRAAFLDDYQFSSLASNTLAAGDIYRANGVAGRSWKETSAGTIVNFLDVQQRGKVPELPAPSPAAITVLAMPLEGGPANGVLAVDVRCQERFVYAR